MTALFDDPALLHDNDVVGSLDGLQFVGNRNDGAILRHAAERLLYNIFRLRV